MGQRGKACGEAKKKKGAHVGYAGPQENSFIGNLVAGSAGFWVRARATAAPLLLTR